MRMKAFSRKGMIDPQAVSVGTRLETVSRTLKTVACEIQYVPILETLHQLFSNKAFVNSLTVAKG